eukprot:CAMPEP_0206160326 /NCGR_PEP_ID=MMETSP1474-20131121/6662_1 /ASSEMBLY_ACC=CAM_ASM_001110 /TAXON_ID=97495 /ORGANISM="Imantonia sp., Strain RCC918" /LENGTH=125 /DNA_ID=CAMNT_0053561589 /DNA_START=79 /DNA_END=456 /DNA_ORIENTATION=+
MTCHVRSDTREAHHIVSRLSYSEHARPQVPLLQGRWARALGVNECQLLVIGGKDDDCRHTTAATEAQLHRLTSSPDLPFLLESVGLVVRHHRALKLVRTRQRRGLAPVAWHVDQLHRHLLVSALL